MLWANNKTKFLENRTKTAQSRNVPKNEKVLKLRNPKTSRKRLERPVNLRLRPLTTNYDAITHVHKLLHIMSP